MSYSPHRRDDRRDRVADPYRGGERPRDGPPEQICGDYQRSNCFRANCRFAHILKNGGGAPPPGPGPVRPPSNADLCKDFIKGRCSRGHSCRYIHIANPGVPFDSFPSFGGPVPHPHGPYAAYAAAYGAAPFFPPNAPFAPGYPSYFGHQMPLPSFPHAPFPPVTPNIELCRDFKHGACSRGEACRFAHIREMCADFLRGKCDRGTECRYSHDKPMSAPCRDYQKGVCTRGSTCRYYHDVAQTCRDYQRGNCERGDACKYIHTARTTTTTTTETKDGTELTRQSSKEHDTMPGMSRKRTRDEDEVGSAHGDDSHHLNHAHMSRNSSRESTSLHRVDEHEQKNETQPGHHERHTENGTDHHHHDQSEDAHERPPKQIKRVHSSDSQDQEEEAPRYD